MPCGPIELRIADWYAVFWVVSNLQRAAPQGHEVILPEVVYAVDADAVLLTVHLEAGTL